MADDTDRYQVLECCVPCPHCSHIIVLLALIIYEYDGRRCASFFKRTDQGVELCETPQHVLDHPSVQEEMKAMLGTLNITLVEVRPTRALH